ncbi:hypothetical protein L873DRAFT_1590947, partial [Choiromyces venosus 120613-1]
ETFAPPEEFIERLTPATFGANVDGMYNYWRDTIRSKYSGTEGRKKLACVIKCLLERDGVEQCVGGAQVPVLIGHGSEDAMYSLDVARMGVERFRGKGGCEMVVVDGGQNLL